MWRNIAELGAALMVGYSNTTTRDDYEAQVAQYPLYETWLTRTEEVLSQVGKKVRVLEYGPAVGTLAARLLNEPYVSDYLVVEPDEHFQSILKERFGDRVARIMRKAEDTVFPHPNCFDVAIMMGSYHHMNDKPLALSNARANLEAGGLLIIAECFFPEYTFNPQTYEPESKAEFVQAGLEYATAQIMAMPSPEPAQVLDQLRTGMLDILRFDELKVCAGVLRHQLHKAGFTLEVDEHLALPDSQVDSGWRFMVVRAV